MTVPDTSIAVAYPGRDGAHSAAACERLFPEGADLRPLPSFLAVVEATAGGEVDFGVLPIESSLAGSVAETHDLLHDYPLSIVAETALRIRHCLVAVDDVPLEEIRMVRSHPVALDQCRALVAAMPWATAIAAATTADAARQVAESGDRTQAAIASERAAQLHGLTVLAGDVGDHPEAYTRFVSVSRYTRIDREARNGALRSRSSPTTRRARSTAPSSRSAACGSTCTNSFRGRSRARRGATASTPCSPVIRSTRS